MANINQFKSRLQGGVRPNLFQVDITFPEASFDLGSIKNPSGLTEAGRFLCRSAQIPAANQGLIEVPFRGRFLKIPGDRTFEPWTATFYNTTDFDLRAAFEQWINIGNKTDEALGTYNFGSEGSFAQYFQDITIRQLDKNPESKGNVTQGGGVNKVLREYKLVGAWPTSVGAINLAYDSNDQIEEFDVEFQYQYLDAGEKNFQVGNGEFTKLRNVGSTTSAG
jgi:hypothetical protein|tara:strand:- start:52 stop:717 length:666 start_codon:yes stop_codon:yes gene_type:complete